MRPSEQDLNSGPCSQHGFSRSLLGILSAKIAQVNWDQLSVKHHNPARFRDSFDSALSVTTLLKDSSRSAASAFRRSSTTCPSFRH